MDINVIKSEQLSSPLESRYIIVNAETNETVDDAQGYGYKSKRKAYAAWTYHNRNKAEDPEREKQILMIDEWAKSHAYFITMMDNAAEYISKGFYGSQASFDSKYLAKMLSENNIELDGFEPKDLLHYWRIGGRKALKKRGRKKSSE